MGVFRYEYTPSTELRNNSVKILYDFLRLGGVLFPSANELLKHYGLLTQLVETES